MRLSYLRLLLILLLCNAAFANNNQQYQIWPGLDITGPLKANSKLRYMLYGEARIFVPSDQLAQVILAPGLGYQYAPTLSFWAGYTWADTESSAIQGMDSKNRLWQQMNWQDLKTKWFILTSRTRLEESLASGQTPSAIRLRKKLRLRLTQNNPHRYTPEIFDEIFVNLNNPAWIDDNQVIDQNRAFVGILIPLSRRLSCEIGYLNQYKLSNSGNQTNNILLLNFKITT